MAGPNLVKLASTLAILAIITVAKGAKAERAATVSGSRGDQQMNIAVDVTPANRGDTLPLCLASLMQAVGRPEWSRARLEGVMGHAFHFEMIEGGGGVMHDNIDWGLALDFVPQLGKFHEFGATKRDTDVDLPALKREARDSVRAGLARGFPALAWQPMSLEQKASDHPAHHAYCWGLIVGYNEAEETYTVRHPYVSETYTVRYDLIGHADPVEWFNIRVYVEPSVEEEKGLHLTALQNAIAFAKGVRYTDERFVRHNGKRSIPYGFAAYELWGKAFESKDDIPLEITRHHAETLRRRRLVAAAYMRELTGLFPEAAEPLEAAAIHYDRELASLNPLYDLCVAAKKSKAWSAENRAEASRLIGEALKADREAVASIEGALALLDRPR